MKTKKSLHVANQSIADLILCYLEAKQKIKYWRNLMADTKTSMDLKVGDTHFLAEVSSN